VRHLHVRSILAVVAVLMSMAAHADDVVLRRGGLDALRGSIEQLDDAGVQLRTTSGAVHRVRWDLVRDVQTDRVEPRLPILLDRAERLWRARSRLERRDVTFAQPLFLQLFHDYLGQTHETALIVAEGLLRCRLEHGENDEAVMPWLEVVRLQRAGVQTVAFATLPPVIDADVYLAPQLPPVFVPTRSLVTVAKSLRVYRPGDDPLVRAFTELYAEGVRQALGQGDDAALAAVTMPEHPGVVLVERIVATGSADAGVREAARQRLGRDVKRLDATMWRDAWIRFAYGRSFEGTTGVGNRELGIVQLIHVPARHGGTQPFLSGLALHLAADELEQLGDGEGAARLRAELERAYPAHPVRPLTGEVTRRIRS